MDFGVVFVGFGINVMEKKVLRYLALTVEKKQPESYAGCFLDFGVVFVGIGINVMEKRST
ncbi:hypothetical protein NST89_10400 [Caldifermentibacillus hisashii]|uniref:hypothetical protein n=1 Tax=Caldifermentibacillus hisashii TaxID=996558 RepID=UPI0031348DD3